jgi:phosphatidylinositol glycan class B
MHKKHSPADIRANAWWIAIFLLVITNLPLAIYLSTVHQRGAVAVMPIVEQQARLVKEPLVLFLMPCHSTPFHSHVGHGIELEFLDCSPSGYRPAMSLDVDCIKGAEKGALQYGLDEADRFYQDPEEFLKCAYPPQGWVRKKKGHGNRLPTHVVMFSGLAPRIQTFCEYGHAYLRWSKHRFG